MTLAPGARLGPYEITGLVGAGGMGEVVRARDTKLNRDVAIKLLPAEFARNADRVARFRREAQVLASLNHTNIAAIYGLEESDGVVALALELVEGEDLAQRLRRGKVPLDETIAIARQIADGLEAAHEKGIVHRDLKPANIKLGSDGVVKLLDFGLAKAYEGDRPEASSSGISASPTLSQHATEAGIILGTAAYMSPEQARGKKVDKRGDIWAFGVVLFEMLTGKRLFQGETVSDTLAAVLRQDVDWSLLPPEMSATDRRTLSLCLERDPKRRLRDIGDVRFGVADPEPRAATGPLRAERNSWHLGLGAVALLAAGSALGYGFGSRAVRPTHGSSDAILKVVPLTASGNVIDAAISPDGQYLSYIESEQGVQSLWLQQLASGQTLRLVPDQVVRYWGHTFTPDGNSVVFSMKTAADLPGGLFSVSTLGGAPKRLLSGLDSAVSFSPDGRQITYLRAQHPTLEESSLMIAGADGSKPTILASYRDPEFVAGIFFGAPAWSPDGRTIVTAVGRRGSPGSERRAKLVAVSVLAKTVSTLADPGWVSAAQAGWLADGKSLLVIAQSKTGSSYSTRQVWIVSVPGGEARPVTTDLNDHRVISLTRDGRSLVSISTVTTASMWTMPLRGKGSPRRISRSAWDGLRGLAFTPDGKIVYSSYERETTSLWKAGADGAERRPLVAAGADESLGFPAVSEDGTVYYAASRREGVEIRAASPDGASSRVVTRDASFQRPGLSRDGRMLVYTSPAGGTPHLFRIAPNGEKKQISDAAAFLPAVDPAGQRVAFYYTDADKLRLGVSPIDGGSLLASFPSGSPSDESRLLLTDDGLYVNTMPGDLSNVWVRGFDGSARKVTSFEDQILWDFAISADGSTLAVVRGIQRRDAQLITGFEATAFGGSKPGR